MRLTDWVITLMERKIINDMYNVSSAGSFWDCHLVNKHVVTYVCMHVAGYRLGSHYIDIHYYKQKKKYIAGFRSGCHFDTYLPTYITLQ